MLHFASHAIVLIYLSSNAPDLIRDYFEGKEKKTKKAGSEKPRQRRTKSEDTEMDDQIEGKRSKKKSTGQTLTKGQRSNGRTSLRAVDKGADTDAEMAPSEDAQSGYGTMDAYAHKDDWTDIIDEILTVDYTNDASHSVIYFLRLWVLSGSNHTLIDLTSTAILQNEWRKGCNHW